MRKILGVTWFSVGERRGVSLCQSIKEDYTKFTPKYLPMKERGRGGYKNYAELLGGDQVNFTLTV